MSWVYYILIFIGSCGLLFFSGRLLIDSLVKIAKFLGWKEFVIAFLAVAVAGSIPNLFLGLSTVYHGIPQLAFGDTLGGNIIDLTLIIALATLVAKKIPAKSRIVQSSAIFTAVIAVLPLFLIFDGVLSRMDGLFLISLFFFYLFWLFSKKERFAKNYNNTNNANCNGFNNNGLGIKEFFQSIGKVLLGVILLIFAAEGMVRCAQFFAQNLDLPLVLIGMLIVGLGNTFPEMYFTIMSAKKGRTWFILGDLMGVVVVSATLVLGIVAFLCPIEITNFSPYVIARIFLLMAALFFLIFVRTDKTITRKEALFLLSIYFVFVAVEIFFR